MDASEPSTNGISASNLYRLSSLLNDDTYSKKAKETVAGFESEMLQYPWLFASFMPSIVAGHLGLKGVVVSGEGIGDAKIKAFEKQPRGGLGTFAKLDSSNSWLRQRNSLLKDFGLDGKPKVLICEGSACREEGLETRTAKEPLDLGNVADALPTKPTNQVATEPEKENKEVAQAALPGKENVPLS
jgi:uncharacterized protein YyaL (SSP411 family)